MTSPENLRRPNSVFTYYTSHEGVRDAAIGFVNLIGRTKAYRGVSAKEVQRGNPIGVEPLFEFDVDAKDHIKSMRRSLRILMPILELEYKTFGSVERFKQTVSDFN